VIEAKFGLERSILGSRLVERTNNGSVDRKAKKFSFFGGAKKKVMKFLGSYAKVRGEVSCLQEGCYLFVR